MSKEAGEERFLTVSGVITEKSEAMKTGNLITYLAVSVALLEAGP